MPAAAAAARQSTALQPSRFLRASTMADIIFRNGTVVDGNVREPTRPH